MPALFLLFRGPMLGAAAVLGVLVGGWLWLVMIHDPAIRAEYAAERDAQVAAARAEDQRRAVAALADMELQQRQALAQAATTRERIIRVPVTTACSAAPAVAAALDGLRAAPGGAGAPRDPGAAAGLPARPAAPAAGH